MNDQRSEPLNRMGGSIYESTGISHEAPGSLRVSDAWRNLKFPHY